MKNKLKVDQSNELAIDSGVPETTEPEEAVDSSRKATSNLRGDEIRKYFTARRSRLELYSKIEMSFISSSSCSPPRGDSVDMARSESVFSGKTDEFFIG